MSNQELTMQDNPIRTHQRREFQKRMERLQSEFNALDKEDVRSLPEGIFVRDFLPLFSGESVENRETLLGYWYLIAGTPYHPVNLVDEAGRVVVQVPPLQDRNVLSAKPNNAKELSVVFEEAKQKSSLSPALGQQMIAAALNSQLQTKTTTTVNETWSKQWETVLSRYGKTLSKSAAGVNANQQPGESDFEIE